jgi:hypothetical protein
MQIPGSMRTGHYLLNDHRTFINRRSGALSLAASLIGMLIGFAGKYAVSIAWVWRRVV